MTEKTINCAECGNSFTYTPNSKYIDKRKYCNDCGKKKNEEWIASQENTDKPDTTPEEATKSEPKTNGYKLTEENIRIGALTCAIEYTPENIKLGQLPEDTKLGQLWDWVKIFEEYIRNGR